MSILSKHQVLPSSTFRCRDLSAVFIFRKSTFFNVLTKSQAAAENFPFCTIDPNESRVPIPDERYDFLCQFHKPARYGVSSFTHYSPLHICRCSCCLRNHTTMLLSCSSRCFVWSPIDVLFFFHSKPKKENSRWYMFYRGCLSSRNSV